jgi:hypothetical protein
MCTAPGGLWHSHLRGTDSNLTLQNREETHHRACPGRSNPGAGWKGGGLGVLLQPALHLREPKIGAHRLPQENNTQAPV